MLQVHSVGFVSTPPTLYSTAAGALCGFVSTPPTLYSTAAGALCGFVYTPPTLYSTAAGALGWVCLHSSHTVQYCWGGTGLGLFPSLPQCTVYNVGRVPVYSSLLMRKSGGRDCPVSTYGQVKFNLKSYNTVYPLNVDLGSLKKTVIWKEINNTIN